MIKTILALFLVCFCARPASAGILPVVTHPIRHLKRDAKAVVHAAGKTIKAAAKAVWYL